MNLPNDPIPKDLALPQCPAFDVEKLVSVQQLGGKKMRTEANRTPVSRRPGPRRTKEPRPTTPMKEAQEIEVPAIQSPTDVPETANVSWDHCTGTGGLANGRQEVGSSMGSLSNFLQLRHALQEVRRRSERPEPPPISHEELTALLSDLTVAKDSPAPKVDDFWELGLEHNEELTNAVHRHLQLRSQPAPRAPDPAFSHPPPPHLPPPSLHVRPDTKEIGLQTPKSFAADQPEGVPACGDVREAKRTAPDPAESSECEEEEFESEEEEECEWDSELAALYEEYNRLWYWAQFYSGEYERACKKHESLLEVLSSHCGQGFEYDTQCADDEAEDEESE